MINSDADNPAPDDNPSAENAAADDPAARAHELYASGLSKAEVAREMGISEWAAMIHLRDVQLRYPSRRVRAKDELRERARALRADGATYDEIAAELSVSKSSVSLWVRDITVPVRPYDPERAARAREARWGERLRKSEAERQATKQASAALVGELSDREVLLVGATAYWCEGAKDKPYQRRESLIFVNTDEGLIQLFLRFLELVEVPAESVTFRVHIHETADVAGAEQHWRAVVGDGWGPFLRTSLKRDRPRTNRRWKEKDYRGCLVIKVRQSTGHYRHVEGLWQGIARGVVARPIRLE